MRPPDPRRLSKRELGNIVLEIQGWFYLDTDAAGNIFWNRDKELDGSETIEFVDGVLGQAKLAPSPRNGRREVSDPRRRRGPRRHDIFPVTVSSLR